MQTQTRLFSSEYPPRPLQDSEEVRKRAVNRILPKILAWNQGHFDEEKIQEDFLHILRYTYDFDGYALAKRLDESRGWTPDSHLVEVLDNFAFDVLEAYEEIVREWVRAHDLQLSLKVGDPVSCKVNNLPCEGVVTGLNPDMAVYLVQVAAKNGSTYLLPFEQVQLRSGGSSSAAL